VRAKCGIPPSLGCAPTKRYLTLSANNHENLKFAPVGRVAPEILRQPALETGPAKLYERLAMRVCCAADRVGRTDVRYPAETIEAMRQHLLTYRDGLGYQAAMLAELAGRVYSVEIIDELAQRAIRRLTLQGYTNVEVRIGNGYWPEHAPFDKVMVTAAPDLIPPPLINQLKVGARMVIPVGLLGAQQLVVVKKDLNGKVTTKEIMPVLFSVLEGSDQPAFRAS
jgi:Protein-L-isoaspartate(D-aspartate) O-methyltransferase (PCMT)